MCVELIEGRGDLSELGLVKMWVKPGAMVTLGHKHNVCHRPRLCSYLINVWGAKHRLMEQWKPGISDRDNGLPRCGEQSQSSGGNFASSYKDNHHCIPGTIDSSSWDPYNPLEGVVTQWWQIRVSLQGKPIGHWCLSRIWCGLHPGLVRKEAMMGNRGLLWA